MKFYLEKVLERTEHSPALTYEDIQLLNKKYDIYVSYGHGIRLVHKNGNSIDCLISVSRMNENSYMTLIDLNSPINSVDFITETLQDALD